MNAGLLELVELDVDLHDSPDCEECPEGHDTACTHVVTHRIIACNDSILACGPAVTSNLRDVNDPAWSCRYCSGRCIQAIPV